MKFKGFVVFFIVAMLTGCSANSKYSFCSMGNVGTEIESYKESITLNRVVVDSDPQFASAFCEAFDKSGIECSSINDVVSPLKRTSDQEFKNILRSKEYDMYITLQSGNDSTQRSYGGSISTFQASNVGNQLIGSSNTTSLVYTSRGMPITVTGYNVISEEKVYLAKTLTSGSGTACVGNDVYSISLAKTVVADLVAK
jgi:hypothetical protein